MAGLVSGSRCRWQLDRRPGLALYRQEGTCTATAIATWSSARPENPWNGTNDCSTHLTYYDASQWAGLGARTVTVTSLDAVVTSRPSQSIQHLRRNEVPELRQSVGLPQCFMCFCFSSLFQRLHSTYSKVSFCSFFYVYSQFHSYYSQCYFHVSCHSQLANSYTQCAIRVLSLVRGRLLTPKK